MLFTKSTAASRQPIVGSSGTAAASRGCGLIFCCSRGKAWILMSWINLNFNDKVKHVCRASLFHIRALRHIRKSLTADMANSVACAFVQSRIDYANSLYTGMSSANFNKLQMVQNTLARVVTLTKKRDHIQPTLKRLHWLPIRQRVNYKEAMLTYTIRLSGVPHHLNAM